MKIWALLVPVLLTFGSLLSKGNDIPKLFPVTEFGPNFPLGGVKGGFIDDKGTVVLPPTSDFSPPHHFDDSPYFVEGLEPVAVKIKSRGPLGEYGYMNTKFQMAIAPQFGLALPFSEGLAAVRTQSGYGFIDHSGKYVISPQFDQATKFSEGLAVVMKTGGWLYGFVDRDGKWLVPPQYPSAQNFSDGLACVGKYVVPHTAPPDSRDDAKMVWGFIDKKGAQVIDFKYSDPTSFSEGLAAINNVKNGCGYIDKTGAYVIPQKFFMGWPFRDGLARVQTKDAKMAYINKQGDIVFTVPKLEWANPFSEGLAAAAIPNGPGKRLYGYIDKTGTFVIPPQFQQASSFANGLAHVFLGNESGYIDKTGNFVWKQDVSKIWQYFLAPH